MGEVQFFVCQEIWKGRTRKGGRMQTRVATLSIIVENTDSVEKLNTLLHEYGEEN